ncbi:hypothetical protein PVA38_11300 [Streptococcus pneumoniae D39]|nr:hypothetical protein PVA38_11300 [Streptococcus pneumoniae D39]
MTITLSVSYTHLRAHETVLDLVCRLLLEKKNIPHFSISHITLYFYDIYFSLSSLSHYSLSATVTVGMYSNVYIQIVEIY